MKLFRRIENTQNDRKQRKNGCNTDSDQREKGQKKEDKLVA